jgi:hypothetical protein
MKTSIITFLILINTSCLLAQDTDNNKLKIHSITAGFGGYHFKNRIPNDFDSVGEGGVTTILDADFEYNKNLFAVSYQYGEEISLFGSKVNYKFHEFDLLYGKELKVANWMAFEGFVGFGFFSQNSRSYEASNVFTDLNVNSVNSIYDVSYVPIGQTISFPIRINTKFYFGSNFGMGLNTNYSFNQINDIFSMNLIFHYRF